MFCDRIVLLFPSIQCSPAFETCCVVWVALIGLVEESCSRQLKNDRVRCGRQICEKSVPSAYLCRRRACVRPCDESWALHA